MSDEQDNSAPQWSGRGAVPEWSPPPPGYPSHPPTFGAPSTPPVDPVTATAPVPVVPPPTATVPPVPAAPVHTAPPSPLPPAPTSSGLANWLKIVLALALTAIAVGVVGIAATSGFGSTPRPGITVDQCEITPRGEVIAGGTVTNPDDVRRTARLGVRLSSVRGGTWFTTTRLQRILDAGDQAEWSTSVTAPSNVDQVRCEVVDATLD